MLKLILTIGLAALLTACSGMSGLGSASSSDGRSGTNTMGAGNASGDNSMMQRGGPRGSSGGGP